VLEPDAVEEVVVDVPDETDFDETDLVTTALAAEVPGIS
jgi:hypothetical protein